jgi:S-adenosylmethionine-diacylglycerol 3-amino-3-carboxypropyl transferase
MSHIYFDKLNYSLSNEDTRLEQTVLPFERTHIVAIAGSGSRVLPLFAKNPKIITICDYSQEQLNLTKLRIETLRHLAYEEFCAFWGYPGPLSFSKEEKLDILNSLSLEEFADRHAKYLIEQSEQTALIYQGKYEHMLKTLSSAIQFALGKKVINHLAQINNLHDFHMYLKNEFPHFRWKLLILLLGNSTLLNALLYKGHHPQKNIRDSYVTYYSKMFERLFSFLTIKESFFLQMLFLGKIVNLTGAPLEAHADQYQKMQAGIREAQIFYKQGEILKLIDQMQTPIDFISFSDVLSYFPSSIENSYLQTIRPKLSLDAITVHRYYLRQHFSLNTFGYQNINDQFQNVIKNEKTQIYHIDIYRKTQ